MGRRAPLSTAQEAELVRRYQAGEQTLSLCAAFDRSDTGVRNILRRHGVVPSHGMAPLATEQKVEALRLYADGLNSHQVGEKLGITSAAVIKAVRRTGGAVRAPVKRRLLTPEQTSAVAAEYRAGGTYDLLTKKYGVSTAVIQRALKEHGVATRVGWASYRVVEYTDRHGTLHRMKSTWEAATARWLDAEGLDWKYEPCRFGLKVARCYTPDFGVYVGGELSHFVEVKGWLTPRVEKKMLEFRRTYPSLHVVLVGPAELAKLGFVAGKYENHPQAGRVAVLREAMGAVQ